MRFRSVFLLIVVCSVVVAQGDPYLATVSGDKVRLRGGPADFHAILDEMAKGTPVRVVGSEGDWKRVEVPGGFDVFVSVGKKGRSYMDTSEPGAGIVLVDDLMIRGTPSTDFPPVGRLSAGERVVVLETKDGWVTLLSPAAARSWIHGKFVARADDQAATLVAFNNKHEANRQALLSAGAASRELLKRQQEERERRARVRAAFERYDAEQAKRWDQRDVSGTRAALLKLRDGLPEGDGDRVRIVAMLKSLDDWESAASDLKGARERLDAAKKKAEEAEKTYASRLRDLKDEIEAEGKQAATSRQSRYMARGHVQRMFPVDALRSGPTWAVTAGDRPTFYLDGDRYNWAEYEGKLIGVLQAEPPETRLGLNVRVIKVSKIEILDG